MKSCGHGVESGTLNAARWRTRAIAEHTAVRGSGRVGRTEAGRALEDEALRLAVIAAIRHRHTSYDELLMKGVDRLDARGRVRDQIEEALELWSAAPVH
jgi:hypothetical protein